MKGAAVSKTGLVSNAESFKRMGLDIPLKLDLPWSDRYFNASPKAAAGG